MIHTTELHYWPIQARAQQIAWLIGYHSLPVELIVTAPLPGTKEWTEYTSKSHMGQLPCLIERDEESVIGQSGTIFRYLIEKHLLSWDIEDDELHQESCDIFSILASAHYSENRKESMRKAFSDVLPRHLEYAEKRIQGEESPKSGEIALASVLAICEDLEPTCLQGYAKLYKLVEGLRSHSGIEKIEQIFSGRYLKRE